jgi:hypothetical protein
MGKHIKPSQSKVNLFPKEIREIIHEMLDDVNATYENIAETVTGMGYEISRSAVGRYALGRYKESQAVKMRLAIVREQANYAAEMVKSGNITNFGEALLGIVGQNLMTRIATASPEEFDAVEMKDLLKAAASAARSLNAIDRTKFQKDKGKGEIMGELEATLDKYLDDNPALKAELLDKLERQIQ